MIIVIHTFVAYLNCCLNINLESAERVFKCLCVYVYAWCSLKFSPVQLCSAQFSSATTIKLLCLFIFYFIFILLFFTFIFTLLLLFLLCFYIAFASLSFAMPLLNIHITLGGCMIKNCSYRCRCCRQGRQC